MEDLIKETDMLVKYGSFKNITNFYCLNRPTKDCFKTF